MAENDMHRNIARSCLDDPGNPATDDENMKDDDDSDDSDDHAADVSMHRDELEPDHKESVNASSNVKSTGNQQWRSPGTIGSRTHSPRSASKSPNRSHQGQQNPGEQLHHYHHLHGIEDKDRSSYQSPGQCGNQAIRPGSGRHSGNTGEKRNSLGEANPLTGSGANNSFSKSTIGNAESNSVPQNMDACDRECAFNSVLASGDAGTLSNHSYDSSSLARPPLPKRDVTQTRQTEYFRKRFTESHSGNSDVPKSIPWIEPRKRSGGMESMSQSRDKFVYICILIVILVIALVWSLIGCIEKTMPHASNPSSYQTLRDSLDELQLRFPSQSDKFWKTVRVGLRSILEETEAISPAVFILVSNTDQSVHTTRCIAREIAFAVTKAFSSNHKPVEILGTMPGSPKTVKMEIDDKIGQELSEGARAVVIDSLEKLHGESAMIFHGYCDNENAQYTRVAYFFTLLAAEEIKGSAESEGDRFVERVLHGRWRNHLDKDMLEPLVARIGNSNVFVNAETSDLLANSCH